MWSTVEWSRVFVTNETEQPNIYTLTENGWEVKSMVHASFYQDCNTHQIFMNHWSKIHGTSKHSPMCLPFFLVSLFHFLSNKTWQNKAGNSPMCVYMFFIQYVHCTHWLDALKRYIHTSCGPCLWDACYIHVSACIFWL